MGAILNSLGSTRSCHKPNHLLQTPDTFVRATLPGMTNATAIVHAAPAIGANFTQYTTEMEAGATLMPNGCQRFLYVLSGNVKVDSDLSAGAFCYLPGDFKSSIEANEASQVVVVEKPYEDMAGVQRPKSFFGSISSVAASPLMGDPNVRVQTLVPETPPFDFAVNVMTFDPGAALAMVEIHFMEHGLLMLEGGGIYRLGDCWHSVTAGDFIWMAPYCPQWFGALGKKAAQYLIFKDWNRAPKARE